MAECKSKDMLIASRRSPSTAVHTVVRDCNIEIVDCYARFEADTDCMVIFTMKK